jgi:hypothetical protein
MENTEQPSLTEILTSEEPPPPAPVFPCPKCDREFTKPMALQMHNLRVHTDKLGDGFKWKSGIRYKGNKAMPVQTEEERLAKKRAYNRKYRLRKGMTAKPERFAENKRKVGGYTGMPMPKWSAARRRKFNAKRKAMLNHKLETPKPAPAPVAQSVTFCPRCGCNIEVVRKAIEFADRV